MFLASGCSSVASNEREGVGGGGLHQGADEGQH